MRKRYRWYHGARIEVNSSECTLLFECKDLSEDENGKLRPALVQICLEMYEPLKPQQKERPIAMLELWETQVRDYVEKILRDGIDGIPGNRFRALDKKEFLELLAKTNKQ